MSVAIISIILVFMFLYLILIHALCDDIAREQRKIEADIRRMFLGDKEQ